MPEIDPMASALDFYLFHMKRLRDASGLSQEALGAKVGYTGKLIGLVETKKRRPNIKLSAGMDELFGIEKFFEAMLPRIAEEAGLPPGFWEYVEEEARASQIRMYNQNYIPGLLQTEDYARAVVRAGRRPDKVDELVSTRMERQEILRREVPPNVVVLLEEGVLRKMAGSLEVTRQQLVHLIKLIQEPNISIYVIPERAQVFPESSFTVLSFDSEPDLGYEESVGGRGRLLEAGYQVTELGVGFELIRESALTAADSEALIRSLMESG
ncbi:helix-turn-helix transcriptional regulator [Actinomadura soli]|uniref:Helix-turn-helix transcriptional regulator n=1 Tax=Actinomadura soli TaxID=2508997 RepID=A0A5C4J4N1_9ACTN|nr:helix-turn-helix transcriptional regulator [Actinomadura soli]TMQ91377.1 helix-turn-helix transcriptional regulator [Actinomadura soli]